MKSSEVRKKFLDFFKNKGHKLVESSSLIPFNDNTLLFTNAGMNQFKDVFLGFESRNYSTAVSAQKCLRAGGKHNDLEKVGYTDRHHTFFEMLGNFSFGDYFKEDAISYAWEFLTDKNWLSLSESNLLVTVYDKDQESYDIWKNKIGLPDSKIIRIGDKNSKFSSDNFWQMGEVGPCGPCSEIFYDHGDQVFGGLPGSENEDGNRYVEIWNCVFMEYNIDENDNMTLLPKRCVDTGMGLERITAVMQKVHSNYHIDLFQNLIKSVAKYTNTKFDLDNNSLRVIADHIRSSSFLIADGILPGNEGRNYILRRIIRRAIRHGFKLGQKEAFFYKIADDLVNNMGQAYPELEKNLFLIKDTLYSEEIKFSKTLESGLAILNKILDKNPKVLNGELVFKLYDTYGFPLDLTSDICKERGVIVDEHEFNKKMQIQRERAKLSSKFKTSFSLEYDGCDSKFVGYDNLTTDKSKVISLFNKDNDLAEALQEGDVGIIILDVTPFYAQSGGQIGDKGSIYSNNNVFEVSDTKKVKSKVFGHYGIVTSGVIRVNDIVKTNVNGNVRKAIMRNHSVTHLLHSSLIKLFGDHVKQKGSLVTEDKTRFDFSHDKPLSFSEIMQVENLVNQAILNNYDVSSQIKPYKKALSEGAIALFDEKYEDEVRVIKISDYSVELCGGTHVTRTGDIGFFKIISETGIASGIRRIEGITGINSVNWVHNQEKLLQSIMLKIKAKSKDEIIGNLDILLQDNTNLNKKVLSLRNKTLEFKIKELKNDIKNIAGINCLFQIIDMEVSFIRNLVIDLTSTNNNLVVLLASVIDNKISICCGVSKDLINKIKANDLIQYALSYVDGKGGGSALLAQGSGNNLDKLSSLMNILTDRIISESS